MKKAVLKNGLTVIIEKRPTKSVAIEVKVKTGSNNESKKIGGISHLIEHMLFEGTKKRSAKKIANEIEKRGGEFNAYTSNEVTAFYITILKKYFDIALEIISDLIKNPVFDEHSIKKEKGIVLDEIKLINDQPRFYQWILFSKTLFKGSLAGQPTYGTEKSVRSLKREDLLDYYSKYYSTNNIIISVVGNVKDVLPKISNKFSDLNQKNTRKFQRSMTKSANTFTKKTMTKQTLQSYVLLGYKTPKRADSDSYVFDVIRAILGRGQSGRLFEEIRQKRGLAYEVGVHHEPNINYGFFTVYLSTDKKNIKNCIGIILNEFKNLQDISSKDLKEAKNYLEGGFHLENEDNTKRADFLTYWQLIGDAELINSYIKNIKKVTKSDIKRVVKKYLNKNYTLIIIKQK